MDEYSFRKANKDDMMLMYEWANDDSVRNNSFNTEKISLDEHKIWYNKLLCDENKYLFIFMVNGNDTGKMLLSINGFEAEIGYSIAKEYRTMNYSKVMITEFEKIVKTDFPDIKKLYARVKENNIASQKALVYSGFKKKCYVYEYDLSEHKVKNVNPKSGGGTAINK